MTKTPKAADAVPATLAQAHEVLLRSRPRHEAEPDVWVAFHRHCAEMYAAVAKIDTGHRHEAGYWAAAEIRRAREIEDGVARR
jgi:hypothetical protein